MKIVSWNINGIRATKSGVKGVLDSLEADIICLQETKVTRDLLDEPTAVVDGYNSYFSFSRGRSGYSGVATFCRDSATPVAAEEGLSGLLTSHAGTVGHYGEVEDFTEDDLLALDNEGRAVVTCHEIQTHDGRKETLTVINVYCPRADPEKPERKDFKLRFYRLLQARAEAILRAGSRVIVLGDVNTSHRIIDTCDPQDPEFFEEHPGRKWLNQFLVRCDTVTACSEPSEEDDDAGGETGGLFLDSFRFFHPTQKNAFTCWCTTTGARQTNYGTRIDYIFGDRALVEQEFEDSVLMADVEGSDHCPIKAVLKSRLVPAPRCPPFCTKHLPEFAGKQQKVSQFLVRIERRAENGLVPGDLQSGVQESSKVPEKLGQLKLGQKHGRMETVKKGSKRQKTDISKGQGSLMNFFRPTNSGVEKVTEVMKDSDNKEHCTAERNKSTASSTGPKEVQAEVGATEAIVGPLLRQAENCIVAQEVRATMGVVGCQAKPQADFWKSLLKGPAPPPVCKGHSEPCVLRTVKKEGPNCGKQFYVCARPEGHASNPEARCNFFLWVSKKASGSGR